MVVAVGSSIVSMLFAGRVFLASRCLFDLVFCSFRSVHRALCFASAAAAVLIVSSICCGVFLCAGRFGRAHCVNGRADSAEDPLGALRWRMWRNDRPDDMVWERRRWKHRHRHIIPCNEYLCISICVRTEMSPPKMRIFLIFLHFSLACMCDGVFVGNNARCLHPFTIVHKLNACHWLLLLLLLLTSFSFAQRHRHAIRNSYSVFF